MNLDAYTDVGMALAYHAEQRPSASAIVSHFGDRTFAALNGNANRIVRLLRSGIRITPINFHLTRAEAGYIVDNCDARAFSQPMLSLDRNAS